EPRDRFVDVRGSRHRIHRCQPGCFHDSLRRQQERRFLDIHLQLRVKFNFNLQADECKRNAERPSSTHDAAGTVWNWYTVIEPRTAVRAGVARCTTPTASSPAQDVDWLLIDMRWLTGMALGRLMAMEKIVY